MSGQAATLKRHGGWKFTSVAEGYIENSINNKSKIGQQIEESVSRISLKQVQLEIQEQEASTSTATEKPSKRQKLNVNLGTSSSSNQNKFFRPPSPVSSEKDHKNIINTDADGNSRSVNLSNITGSDNNISFHFTNCNVTINIFKK